MEPRAGPGGGTAHTRGMGKARPRAGAAQWLLPSLPRGLRVGHKPRTGARKDGRTRHPPFLRSSSSTTWMDSSGSFPGRGLRRR